MLCAKVIPLIKLPRNLHSFDYSVPDEYADTITPGRFVSIPFRSRIIPGLVIDVSTQSPSAQTKSIYSLLPLLYNSFEKQLAYIQWFASYYFVSQATALKTLLPDIPHSFLAGKKTRAKKKDRVVHDTLFAINQTLTSSIDVTSSSIFMPRSMQEKIKAYQTVIKKNLEKNKNVVIFFPTIHDVELFAPYACSAIEPEQVVILHSGLTKTQVFNNWAQLFDGRARCILGTRSACCVPLGTLGAVVIDQSERDEHAQYDMNPRYDIRTLATYIEKNHPDIHVYSSSTAPRSEDAAFHQKVFEKATSHEKGDELITVIDRSNEFRGGAYGSLHDTIIKSIDETLQRKKIAFLFLNSMGAGSMVVCKDCNYLFACPSCNEPLKPYTDHSRLTCRACRTDNSFPSHCPTCRSVRLQIIGRGLETLAQHIKKEFPSARIIECSSEKKDDPDLSLLHTKKGQEQLCTNETIIISTTYALSAYPELFSACGTIVLLNADPFITPADFRCEERQWQTLSTLLFYARSFSASIIVQTFHPESMFIQTLIQNDYKKFMDHELTQRKKMAWPPYYRLIHLLTHTSKKSDPLPFQEVRTRLDEMHDFLSYTAYKEKITVRIKEEYIPGALLPSNIQEVFDRLPNDILVDVDPIIP